MIGILWRKFSFDRKDGVAEESWGLFEEGLDGRLRGFLTGCADNNGFVFADNEDHPTAQREILTKRRTNRQQGKIGFAQVFDLQRLHRRFVLFIRPHAVLPHKQMVSDITRPTSRGDR